MLGCYSASEDVHAAVARRVLAEGLIRCPGAGCGEGELARHLPVGGAYLEICGPPICSADELGWVSVFGADNYYVSLDGITFRAN